MPAWNGWYHCMCNTHGTWLPGDPRGFRTRHHREHIEGDYKKPPPVGQYETRHGEAKRKMDRPAVVLSVAARSAALHAVLRALIEFHEVEVLSCAVGGKHMHILARFGQVVGAAGDTSGEPTPGRRGLRERDPARFYMGIAKERSAKVLAASGMADVGGVWAKRGKVAPIKDRSHQLNVFQYILDHKREGASVWSFRNGWPLSMDVEEKPTP